MYQQQMAMVSKKPTMRVSGQWWVKQAKENSQSHQLRCRLLIKELQLNQIKFDVFETSVSLCDLFTNLS